VPVGATAFGGDCRNEREKNQSGEADAAAESHVLAPTVARLRAHRLAGTVHATTGPSGATISRRLAVATQAHAVENEQAPL